MSDPVNNPLTEKKRIIVIHNGPYQVRGGLPLVHKTQVVSEYGEPLTWKKDGEIPSTLYAAVENQSKCHSVTALTGKPGLTALNRRLRIGPPIPRLFTATAHI
jgi:hypothetical protein